MGDVRVLYENKETFNTSEIEITQNYMMLK